MEERKSTLVRVHMRIRSSIGVAAVAAVLVTGCSAKSSAPYPDVTSFCTAKAQAECQISATCGFPSPTDCETARAALCNTDANEAATTGSRTRKYTQANAPKCVDAINSVFGNNASKVSYAQLVGPGSVTDFCERVFSGTTAFNQPCQSSYDCADSADECVPVSPGLTSLICAPPTKVGPGDLCQNAGDVCTDDTYCAPSATVAATCAPSMQEGQSCETAPCVSAQRCETLGSGPTCEPRVEAAGSCATSDDCAPGAPYCDPYVNNKCELGLSFATEAPDCIGFAAGGAASAAGTGDDAGAVTVAVADGATTDASGGLGD
jgi:hypothetical protein